MSADVFGIVGTVQAGIFRVERVVAEGGFAVVYRAYHEGFRAPVALKCLKVPDAMSEAQRAAFLDKFREEGELLFRLSALVPAVVRPLHIDVLVLGETLVPFLALEWLDGEGLDQLVAKRQAQHKPPLDIRRLVPFLQPAAQALAQAHAVPGPDGPIVIIHRDIKPDNIFVAKAPGHVQGDPRAAGGEVVKILDFGIARTRTAAQLDAGEISSNAALDAFTPGYAAPEQWLPKRYGQVGPWTDVFGLAVTMVEALTGRPPFTGEDLGAIAERTTDPDRRPTPRALGVTVSDAVERAFLRALAVDPRQRTRSIVSFWTELEQALGMAPSIKVAEVRARTPSLSGGSEPPPPPVPSARSLALTQLAGPPSTRVRRPDGDLPVAPPAAASASDLPAIPFELAGPPSPARAPRAPLPPFAARPVPVALAPPPIRSGGTMVAPSRGGRELAELSERVRGPIALVVLAIAVTVADQIYIRTTGELFTLAGLRPMWITAPLALIGVGIAVWRLLDVL